MNESIRYLGLDVHATSIACAIAQAGGEVLDLGVIPNHTDALHRLLKKLGKRQNLRVCYEAGPTGYALYWELTKFGVHCDVIAPSLIPRRPGDRVKTDRRDARQLARLYRAGELTPVWVPDVQHEALRDLVRTREMAVGDRTRARNRLTKFLLRRGLQPTGRMTRWSAKYRLWLSSLRFKHNAAEVTFADLLHEVKHADARLRRLEDSIDEVIAASPNEIREIVESLQALRGIAKITSVTLVAEIGRFSRFAHPKQLMGYSGLVPREHSSGARVLRGGITKTGNAHLRRVLVEAAWTIGRTPGRRPPLRGSMAGRGGRVEEIALRAQQRLHSRSCRLRGRGKDSRNVAVAVARELLGFVWAIGVHVEQRAAA